MPKKPSIRRKLSRSEQKNLDVEIRFMAGLVNRDPNYVDALQVLGNDYSRRGLVNEQLRVDRQLAQLLPEDPIVFYNLACSQSLASEFPSAVESLERAMTLGWKDFHRLSRDPDLAGLRKHPSYGRLRDRIKRMKVAVR